MKSEFPFFGIKSSERRAISKNWMSEIQISTEADLFKIVMEL
jgi:3-methyladenine DNA glycosylase AlkD